MQLASERGKEFVSGVKKDVSYEAFGCFYKKKQVFRGLILDPFCSIVAEGGYIRASIFM